MTLLQTRIANSLVLRHTLFNREVCRLSILIRQKKARKRQAQELREKAVRRPHPPMGALALPDDLTGNAVRVIVLGSSRVLVENHLGVADVGRESIRLTTRTGMLSFYGQSLQLTDVRQCALSVCGQIDRIELPRAQQQEGGND